MTDPGSGLSPQSLQRLRDELAHASALMKESK